MTRKERQLLKEIKKIENLNVEEEYKYWQDRFSTMTSEEQRTYREILNSLKRNEYIRFAWEDYVPIMLCLTNNGKSYNFFNDKVQTYGPAILKWIFGILSAIIAGFILKKIGD